MQPMWLTVTYEDGTKWVQNLDDGGSGELEIPPGKRIVRIKVSDESDNPIARALSKHRDPQETKSH